MPNAKVHWTRRQQPRCKVDNLSKTKDAISVSFKDDVILKILKKGTPATSNSEFRGTHGKGFWGLHYNCLIHSCHDTVEKNQCTVTQKSRVKFSSLFETSRHLPIDLTTKPL